MKKFDIIILVIVLFNGIGLSQKINIHTSAGTNSYNLSDVDSITFDVSAEVPTDGLLAYYPFNGNANDESGNGNDGVLFGGASVSDVLILGDNNEDFLSLPYTILNGLSDFTISSLLKINTFHIGGTSLAGNYFISGAKSSDPAANSIYICYYPSLQKWRILIRPGWEVDFEIDTTIEDNNWHYVSVTRENSIAKLFIDGSHVGGEVVVTDSTLVIDPNGLIVGQEQDIVGGGFEKDQSWAGEIDNLAFYNRALSDAEIYSLFLNNGKK